MRRTDMVHHDCNTPAMKTGNSAALDGADINSLVEQLPKTEIDEAAAQLDAWKMRRHQRREIERQAFLAVEALYEPIRRALPPPPTAAEREGQELCGHWDTQVIATRMGVDPTTARRWRRGQGLTPPIRTALRLTLHGDLGALHTTWEGWMVRGDKLHSRDGLIVSPGEIAALPILHQLVRALESQVSQLRAELTERVQADWIDGRYVKPQGSNDR